MSPKKQRERLEKDPIKLKSELHEDRLWVLLQESIKGLNDLGRLVLLAFGEFPVNGLTLSLLKIYLRKPYLFLGYHLKLKLIF